MAEKPQKNGKESCWKYWLNKEKREVSGQNGRVGISVGIPETFFFCIIYASVNSNCAQPPPGLLRGIQLPALSVPGGWAFANFALSGGRAFANPGANHELLTRTQFPVRIQLHKGFYWKNKRIGSFVKEGKQLKRFVKACFAFLHCYQARITWRNRELSTWINGYWIKFLLSIIWRTSFHIFKTIHNS